MGHPKDDTAKQLTRKLFWAVSSTFPTLDKAQRRSTFVWAANLADRILSSRLPNPASQAAWELGQKKKREAAWKHVAKYWEGQQLESPSDVYREVTNGRSNSPG